jgi:hypothetical protein
MTGPHLADVALDEIGVRGGVEVAVHDRLGGTECERCGVGLQGGQRLTLRGFDVGGGSGHQLSRVGVGLGLQLRLERSGRGGRFVEDALTLVASVRDAVLHVRQLGLGLGLGRGGVVELRGQALGAPALDRS